MPKDVHPMRNCLVTVIIFLYTLLGIPTTDGAQSGDFRFSTQETISAIDQTGDHAAGIMTGTRNTYIDTDINWASNGAVSLGGNWMWLDWFGYFNTNSAPWIYHEQHGWLYPFGTSTDSIVFWDPQISAFWWTSRTEYPYVYRFSDGAWLFYEKGSSGPRFFYNLITSKWEGCYANTTRSGAVISDERWGGIIDVTGDVIIHSSATLTIVPGAMVRFAAHSDDQSGGGTTPITDPPFPHDPAIAPSQMSCIGVSGGSLYAVGTAEKRITFTSSSSTPAPADWHSLQYQLLGGKMVVEYAIIEYGYYGIQINVEADDSSVTIRNNMIRQIVTCGICCSPVDPVKITLSGNDISYCGHEGIATFSETQINIVNNLLHDNLGGIDGGGVGVIIDGNSSTITGNSFIGNGVGIYIMGSSNQPVINNNYYEANVHADCTWADGRPCQ